MEVEVFISYSRSDSAQAEVLCAELDRVGIKYWIDRDIHSSANFLTEICQKIISCKVVLFIASEASANSMWTQKEILFAFKHNKSVIPYRLNKFAFDTNHELDFIFTNIQWVDDLNQAVADVYRLCRNEEHTVVKQPTNVDITDNKDKQPTEEQPTNVVPTNNADKRLPEPFYKTTRFWMILIVVAAIISYIILWYIRESNMYTDNSLNNMLHKSEYNNSINDDYYNSSDEYYY